MQKMQTPTSVGDHRGMGDARSGPQLSGESGPDFMMLMSCDPACLSPCDGAIKQDIGATRHAATSDRP